MDDRRRYFRINDNIMLNFYPITEIEAKARIKEIKAGIIRQPNERQPLLGLETQIKGVIEQLKKTSPQVAHVAQLLNQKLSLVMSYVDIPEDQAKTLDNQLSVNASISACGIAFDTNDKYMVDQKIVLEIILPPSYMQMVIIGTVALFKSMPENNSSKYRLAIDFDCITENDQERLIQYILKKQAVFLKEKRMNGLV